MNVTFSDMFTRCSSAIVSIRSFQRCLPVFSAGRLHSTDDSSKKNTKPNPVKDRTPLGKLDTNPHPEAEKEPLPAWPDNRNPYTGEINGPRGPEPTRYGDWERKGKCVDF